MPSSSGREGLSGLSHHVRQTLESVDRDTDHFGVVANVKRRVVPEELSQGLAHVVHQSGQGRL